MRAHYSTRPPCPVCGSRAVPHICQEHPWARVRYEAASGRQVWVSAIWHDGRWLRAGPGTPVDGRIVEVDLASISVGWKWDEAMVRG